jgi:hypothetical protein
MHWQLWSNRLLVYISISVSDWISCFIFQNKYNIISPLINCSSRLSHYSVSRFAISHHLQYMKSNMAESLVYYSVQVMSQYFKVYIFTKIGFQIFKSYLYHTIFKMGESSNTLPPIWPNSSTICIKYRHSATSWLDIDEIST